MTLHPSRRKFLVITAATAGIGLFPVARSRGDGNDVLVEWQGVSMGGIATLRLYHSDRAAAQRLVERVTTEARRLEQIFTLYENSSVLCELNRRGMLVAPPAELIDLLQQCDHAWRVTDGVFDPTVQPLWRCYFEHFSSHDAASAPPPAAKLAEALQLVGWASVRANRDRIVFEKAGMGLTLNGIAQGFITDRIVELLRDAGLEHCIVDMGEIRTIGHRDDGQPWRAELDRAVATGARKPLAIDIVNRAVATSGAYGFQFETSGRSNHLFNPVTGRCADPATTLSVVSNTAAFADALATAFTLMDDGRILEVLKRTTDTQVFISDASGTFELTPAGRKVRTA